MGYTWKKSRSAEMLKFNLFSSERKNSAQLPFSIHRYFKTFIESCFKAYKKVVHMRFFSCVKDHAHSETWLRILCFARWKQKANAQLCRTIFSLVHVQILAEL